MALQNSVILLTWFMLLTRFMLFPQLANSPGSFALLASRLFPHHYRIKRL